MKCGLLGRKLGHSYSPQIHSLLGKYSYDLFEKEPEQLAAFLKGGDFTGINVTIPYKKDVIPYLDALSPAAQKIGSVNTIVRRADGSLFGHNSDYFGFVSLVKHSGIPVEGRKVLVLGSGGTSNMVVTALRDLSAVPIVISRSGENNYDNLERHADASVIVNTTPVGMYPNTGISPIDLRLFPKLEGVLDVVYNPAKTKLLLDAEALGIPNANGLWMLVAQAKEASEYFTGKKLSDEVIGKIHRTLSHQMKNLILIGMPGCGKSTIGAALAQRLGRKFVDADEEVVKSAGKSIPEIFAQDGEEAFRQWETAALNSLGKQSGLVIATGGGCVTQNRNFAALHQNGYIIWLERDLTLLPTDGRPLSQSNRLEEMYKLRKPMYEAFADIRVENAGNPEQTVKEILSQLGELS
ncbi:MAG: shikimate kinase [Clostridiales bacterium]|nr:shikimate kinase [Clostridiales bacterium]